MLLTIDGPSIEMIKAVLLMAGVRFHRRKEINIEISDLKHRDGRRKNILEKKTKTDS